MTTLHNALFLHGGPGLHSAVEREWFGDTLPILWWDQPAVAGVSAPFRTLVAHAGRQLERLADTNDGRVDLIAHSFGGQIAAALAREYPALIRRITLLGCPPDPIQQFFLFARRLLEAGYEYPGLRDALAAADDNCDEGRFFALVQACYPIGSRPDIYFATYSTEIRERYFAMAAKMPPMEAATFFVVMQELMHTKNSTQPSGFDGQVEVIMGKDDPLLDLGADKQKWLGIFPQAGFRVVAAGHGVHFESSPEVWFDKR